jgi:hypothetical protein
MGLSGRGCRQACRQVTTWAQKCPKQRPEPPPQPHQKATSFRPLARHLRAQKLDFTASYGGLAPFIGQKTENSQKNGLPKRPQKSGSRCACKGSPQAPKWSPKVHQSRLKSVKRRVWKPTPKNKQKKCRKGRPRTLQSRAFVQEVSQKSLNPLVPKKHRK